jgi:hypothetical protein
MDTKLKFMEKAPKRSFALIPKVFERWGENGDKVAMSYVDIYTPANYKNLKEVVANNNREEVAARKDFKNNSWTAYLDDKQNSFANQFKLAEASLDIVTKLNRKHFALLEARTRYAEAYRNLQAAYTKHCETVRERTDRIIDGSIGAKNYAKSGLDWIAESAPWVEIDGKGVPTWQVDCNEPQKITFS